MFQISHLQAWPRVRLSGSDESSHNRSIKRHLKKRDRPNFGKLHLLEGPLTLEQLTSFPLYDSSIWVTRSEET